MDWSERIKGYRKSRGLFQKQLAFDLSVDVTTVSRWERGLVEPDLRMQKELALRMEGPMVLTEARIKMIVDSSLSASALLREDFTHVYCNDQLHKENLGNVCRQKRGVDGRTFWPEERVHRMESCIVPKLRSGELTESLKFSGNLTHNHLSSGPVRMHREARIVPLSCGEGVRYLLAFSRTTLIEGEPRD